MKNDKIIPEIVLISPSPFYTLGTNILHSYLVKNYFRVFSFSLFYFNDEEIEKIAEFVHKNKPRMVGSSVYSQSLVSTIDLTKKIKSN